MLFSLYTETHFQIWYNFCKFVGFIYSRKLAFGYCRLVYGLRSILVGMGVLSMDLEHFHKANILTFLMSYSMFSFSKKLTHFTLLGLSGPQADLWPAQ